MTAPRRKPSGGAVMRPAVTEAIADAAIDELVEHGYAKLAMEKVARRAGVGKHTLYRRWPTKVELVTEVLARLSVPEVPAPDTGTLRGDVRAMLNAVLTWLTDPRIRAILPSLIAEYGRNPALAQAAATHIGGPRRAWGRAVLERAQVPVDQIDMILDLMAAPTYWRLVHDRPVDDEYLDRLTDMIMAGITVAEA
ncbi:TetR/AcrR family transcriptional regulator [Mycobacterium sp. C31M]